MSEVAVRIDGLKDFNRALRQMDSDLPKALRIALNQAAQVVIDDASPRVPSRSGRARRSIKPKSTRTSVRVTAGGRTASYYPFLDFGGRVGRKKSVKRAFLKEGRYLYPAYFRAKASGEFERILSKALVDVAGSAGIDVS